MWYLPKFILKTDTFCKKNVQNDRNVMRNY